MPAYAISNNDDRIVKLDVTGRGMSRRHCGGDRRMGYVLAGTWLDDSVPARAIAGRFRWAPEA
jgi:hypothetical protein